MNKQHPDTFFVPSKRELNNLKPLDTVKVACNGERFWTIITEIKKSYITVKVENDLLFTEEHGIKYGDIIRFKIDNIFSIY